MKNHNFTLRDFRNEVVGIDTTVPLLNGTQRRYVFLDNAASTPTFKSVLKCIEDFMPWYSGVHRGMGYKAMVATRAYDQAHDIAGEFVGADMKKNVAIFVKNTTEAANKLASRFHSAKRFPFSRENVVITTMMEHHSNDLPWRKHCKVVHIPVKDDGAINLELLRDALKKYQGSVKLVAVTGASNVTGICNPIHEIAEWVHAAGAKLFVDAAQLVAHRPINILPNDDPRHIDFIAYSAHKIYAPFGTGVLIGPKDFFEEGSPDLVGGGTVSYVGLDAVDWGHAPQKEEAGSPNVVGAIALAKSLSMLKSVGMDVIAEHEKQLLTYAYSKLKKLSNVRLYGPTEDYSKKVGTIPFTVDGIDHALVATILSVEGGVGVRNGNFCAQVYTRKLLHVTPEEEQTARATQCTSPNLPGMVRASLGCYNNEDDLDIFLEMMEKICRGDIKGHYEVDPATGMYVSDHLMKNVTQQLHFFDFSANGAVARKEEVA
jgi:selenocysteine lyase/cysteine desulfurase